MSKDSATDKGRENCGFFYNLYPLKKLSNLKKKVVRVWGKQHFINDLCSGKSAKRYEMFTRVYRASQQRPSQMGV
jgi:RNA:NAD 2'-phosphotransferase (TPT1/KptA family)